jgi:membrane protease YdiL (CAAX protease family)
MVREVRERSKDFLKLPVHQMRAVLLLLAALFIFSAFLGFSLRLQWIREHDSLRRYALQFFLFLSLIFLFFSAKWRPCLRLSSKAKMIWITGTLFYFCSLALLDLVCRFYDGASIGHRRSLESWDQLALSLVLAPILEELFFRDALFRSLVTKFNHARVAAVISSLFFMVAHGSLYPGAFFLGIISCGLFYFSGSIIPSIAFHVLSNLSWFFLPMFFPNLFRTLIDMRLLHWFFQ